MINLIVIAISATMFALLLVWWRWPNLRDLIEAPKYSMLRQERRFQGQVTKAPPDVKQQRLTDLASTPAQAVHRHLGFTPPEKRTK
jgi:hypothetical protein